jgi:L-asparaginase/Glu-tRNA(Gln) amidotransferase subunit D
MLLAIISTGGTIATTIKGREAGLDNNIRLNWVEEEFPDHKFIYTAPLNILSEDANPSDWITLSKQIVELEEKNNPDGYVILHGTDTMCFASAALSFMLTDISKPIVFTGSRRSVNAENTDVFINVCDAIRAASHLPSGTYISFAGDKNRPSLVHLGTRCRKANLNDFQTDLSTFWSIGIEPVAEVSLGQVKQSKWVKSKEATSNMICWKQPSRAALHPGIDLTALQQSIKTDVVIEVYPSCTAPKEFNSFLQQINERGLKTYIVTSNGRIGNVDYPSTKEMRKLATLLPITPETAYVKLGWALGQNNSHLLMTTNIAGEINLPNEKLTSSDF